MQDPCFPRSILRIHFNLNSRRCLLLRPIAPSASLSSSHLLQGFNESRRPHGAITAHKSGMPPGPPHSNTTAADGDDEEVVDNEGGGHKVLHFKFSSKMSLEIGTRVEVIQKLEGLEGSYYAGVVIDRTPEMRKVRYETLQTDDGTLLEETISWTLISLLVTSLTRGTTMDGGQLHCYAT
ncbi:hypothetical protein LXL04_003652 [Taraxacum kok-saghyz]